MHTDVSIYISAVDHRHNRSVGLLSHDVAAGLVVANDEDAAVVAADDAGAADPGGGAPHHLRVVAARLAGRHMHERASCTVSPLTCRE